MEPKNKLYLALIGLVLAATAGVVVGYLRSRPAAPLPAAAAAPEVVVREKEVEKIIEVEKEITAEIIEDELKDVGLLITEEYYFTEVVSYTSNKTLWHFDIPFTESAYLASYEGVVTAGVDFSMIGVQKNDETSSIVVSIPAAVILNVDIDPESFILYEEKTGLGNPVSVRDFNDSLVELENTARLKARERGVLDQADENARRMIRSLITGLVDSSYSIRFAVTE